MLDERIVELRGAPLPLLKKITALEAGVDDVRAFGDRLHIRVKAGQADTVIKGLEKSIPAGGGRFADAHAIPAVLEDVFIALSEQEE